MFNCQVKMFPPILLTVYAFKNSLNKNDYSYNSELLGLD